MKWEFKLGNWGTGIAIATLMSLGFFIGKWATKVPAVCTF